MYFALRFILINRLTAKFVLNNPELYQRSLQAREYDNVALVEKRYQFVREVPSEPLLVKENDCPWPWLGLLYCTSLFPMSMNDELFKVKV